MKKVRTLLAALLLLAALALPVSALTLTPTPVPGRYATAQEMVRDWGSNLPVYIRKVTPDETDPSVLVFHTLGNPLDLRRSIVSQIDINGRDTLRFVEYTYTEAELQVIEQYVKSNYPAWRYGILSFDIMENVLQITIAEEFRRAVLRDMADDLDKAFYRGYRFRYVEEGAPLPTRGADGKYATAEELFYSWQGNWPAGVRNVINDREESAALTFALAPDQEGANARQLIQNSVADHATLFFMEHDLTEEDILSAYRDFWSIYRHNDQLLFAGITPQYIRLALSTYVTPAEQQALAGRLSERYGTAIRIDPLADGTDLSHAAPQSVFPEMSGEYTALSPEPVKYWSLLVGGLLLILALSWRAVSRYWKRRRLK